MSKLRAEIKHTDNGYELILFGAAFQGLKKEIVREGDESGIKYNFRKEGFDLIAKAFSGIGAKAPKKKEEAKPEAIEVKPEDVQPEEVIVTREDSEPVQTKTKSKKKKKK